MKRAFHFSVRISLFTLFLWGCRNPSVPAGPAAGEPQADQTLVDFSIDAFSGGMKNWHLESPLADVFEKTHRIDLEKPRIQFFSNNEPGSRLTAGRGWLDSETKDMRAWDGVTMVSTDGAKLDSEFMDYVHARERILSTAPVTIVRGASVINGVGWEASPDLSDVIVFNQKVEITGEDNARLKRKPAGPKK